MSSDKKESISRKVLTHALITAKGNMISGTLQDALGQMSPLTLYK